MNLMQNETKNKVNHYISQIATINSVRESDVKEGFNVAPSVEQRLIAKALQKSDFLQLITHQAVDAQQGAVVSIGVNQAIARTTDTTKKDRETSDVHQLSQRNYNCQQINFDTHLTYATLDSWKHKSDFQQILASQTQKTIANNILMMGFNGRERASDSDPIKYPLLDDVAIGWLQKIRNDKPENVLGGKNTLNKNIKYRGESGLNEQNYTVYVGKGHEYENLDALVMDCVDNIISEIYQDDTDLVVICGRRLLSDKYFTMVNKMHNPTDELASQVITSQRQIGSLKAIRVPYFPPRSLLITKLSNLALYTQKGTMRRAITNNPKRDRIEDYLSQNIDFQVLDYECTALIDGILLEDKETTEKKKTSRK